MAQAYPSLNGIAQSWADIVVTMPLHDGPLLEMIDISDINHESMVEVGEQRGASGGRVLKRTRGALSDSCGMTLYASGADRFEAALAAVAPVRGDERLIRLVHFDIIVQHTPPNSTDIRSIEMLGVCMLGRGETYSEGTDADKCDVSLSVAKIVKVVNGTRIVLL